MATIGDASYVGGPDPAFGPNDPAVELINHLAEFVMAHPTLAAGYAILAISVIAIIFGISGVVMGYSVYLSQRLYGWGPHGESDRA